MTPTPRTAIIAGRPSNLRLPPGMEAAVVDSDMFNICERVREYDPNVMVVLLDGANYAITETDRTGSESLLFRVGPGCDIDALDGRVIERLNYIRTVPLHQRVAELEREIARERAAAHEAAIDNMYEVWGGELYDSLFRAGFVHEQKPESVRPLNATAKRAGRHI